MFKLGLFNKPISKELLMNKHEPELEWFGSFVNSTSCFLNCYLLLDK